VSDGLVGGRQARRREVCHRPLPSTYAIGWRANRGKRARELGGRFFSRSKNTARVKTYKPPIGARWARGAFAALATVGDSFAPATDGCPALSCRGGGGSATEAQRARTGHGFAIAMCSSPRALYAGAIARLLGRCRRGPGCTGQDTTLGAGRNPGRNAVQRRGTSKFATTPQEEAPRRGNLARPRFGAHSNASMGLSARVAFRRPVQQVRRDDFPVGGRREVSGSPTPRASIVRLASGALRRKYFGGTTGGEPVIQFGALPAMGHTPTICFRPRRSPYSCRAGVPIWVIFRSRPRRSRGDRQPAVVLISRCPCLPARSRGHAGNFFVGPERRRPLIYNIGLTALVGASERVRRFLYGKWTSAAW